MACQSGFFLLTSGASRTCVADCGSDALVPSTFDGTCRPCQYPCATCSGTEYACLSCVNGFYFLNGCFGNCPTHFYSDPSNVCRACQDSCLRCTDPATCTSCTGSFFLEGSLCLTACPTGKFPQSELSNNACVQCDAACSGCSDSLTCTGCVSDTQVIRLGSCLDSCGAGYSPVEGLCQPCQEYCAECTSPSACSRCGNSYMEEGRCVLACQPSFFAEVGSSACQPCLPPCRTCRSAFFCTGCVADYLLYQDFCLPGALGCPPGLYLFLDDSSCVENCDSPLLQIASAMQCASVCPFNYFRRGLLCLDSCPQGEYYSPEEECAACSGCTRPFFNLTVFPSDNLIVLVVFFSHPSEVGDPLTSFRVDVQERESTAILTGRRLATTQF